MNRKIIGESRRTGLLSEGKHWPEDYKKTAFNAIKQSYLGLQSWYADKYILQDVETFASEFGPLSHKNSNLGFFATIIRWFIDYSGADVSKYKEFIEVKLDSIIRDLQVILNDPKLDQAKRDALKKISFADFEKMQKEKAEALKRADSLYFGEERDDYDLVFIKSYEELHNKFGGDRTGYKGESEWCHTNSASTHESWTSNGTKFFFVLAKKGWEKILPPNPKTTNAYDEYGTSLIAILVEKDGTLLNATLRWNHVIEPSKTVPGTSVDRAFLTWKDLADVVKMDVKSKVLQILKVNKLFSKYGKNVYSGAEGLCYVYEGHFIWTDKEGNEIRTPQEVGGCFDCSHCASLESLKGVPREVGGYFDCSKCTSLKSLEGAPQEVGGYFDCSHCASLSSLEGAPLKVGGCFGCSECTSLESLKGAPREVGGDFSCSGCSSLPSLAGAPNEIIGDFDCAFTKITSLEGAPQEVGGYFDCSHCASLSSLEGAPLKVEDFFCDYCISLTSLEGAPQEIIGVFDCTDCTSLESLKGAPRKVKDIYASKTKLSTDKKNAYRAWLKTNPTENYHETHANESVQLVCSIVAGNAMESKVLLEKLLKKKVTKRIVEVLSQRNTFTASK